MDYLFLLIQSPIGLVTAATGWFHDSATTFAGMCAICAWYGGHHLGWLGLGLGTTAAGTAGGASAAGSHDDWDPQHLVPTDPKERHPYSFGHDKIEAEGGPIGWVITLISGGSAAIAHGVGHGVAHVAAEVLVEHAGEKLLDHEHKEPVEQTEKGKEDLETAYDSLEQTLKDKAKQKATKTEPWRQ